MYIRKAQKRLADPGVPFALTIPSGSGLCYCCQRPDICSAGEGKGKQEAKSKAYKQLTLQFWTTGARYFRTPYPPSSYDQEVKKGALIIAQTACILFLKLADAF